MGLSCDSPATGICPHPTQEASRQLPASRLPAPRGSRLPPRAIKEDHPPKITDNDTPGAMM
ncbi:hypothetical protein ACHAXT_002693 [Thalassiosira profunda]